MSTTNKHPVSISTIGRAVLPSYPTNLAILVLSLMALIAGVVVSRLQGDGWSASWVSALQWGGVVFLSWALGRETDPDRWYSAFLAAAGALAGCIVWGAPSFSLLFWVLLGLRFVNRTPGLAPGVLDLLLFYGLSLWLGYAIHWTIPVLAIGTIPFVWSDKLSRVTYAALALTCGAAAAGGLRGWRVAAPIWGWWGILGTAIAALLLIPVGRSYQSPRSVCDQTGAPLESRRVRWALAWSAGSAWLLATIGAVEIPALAPIWAAFTGTFVGWLIEVATGTFRRAHATHVETTKR